MTYDKRKYFKIDSIDEKFLEEKRLSFDEVNASFFHYSHDWQCPCCDISKHDLLHQRKNGVWYSGIEKHHFGEFLPQETITYYNQQTEPICYKCNTFEKNYRKKHNLNFVLSPDEIRQVLLTTFRKN